MADRAVGVVPDPYRVWLSEVMLQQTTVAAVKAYFDKNGGGWPVLNNPTIPIQFHVSQIPESFVVAPSGEVVAHFAGEMTADQVIADPDQLHRILVNLLRNARQAIEHAAHPPPAAPPLSSLPRP